MNERQDVLVTMPAHGPAAVGRVGAVWHAVDGVRVAIRFLTEGAPCLPIGRAGELHFQREGVEGTAQALGKVAFRGDHGAERVYHFLFGERTRQTLARLLEPRRTHRAYPDPDEPLEVTLLLPDGGDKALILPARDVSGTGLGVDVPWEFESRLCQLDRVDLRLRLPGSEDELAFGAVVRNRALGQGAICYGLELERAAPGVPDPRFDALEAYVRTLGGEGQGARRRSA